MTHQWHSAGHADQPQDQQRDLSGPYWAELGPKHGGWSWEIFNFDADNATVASGVADTEEAAKTAVSGWENP